MMKNKIQKIYPTFKITDFPSSQILYIFDFTTKTNGLRDVEIADVPFSDNVNSLIIENQNKIPVSFANIPAQGVFYKKNDKCKDVDDERCEGTLFPDVDITENPFILFVEIKDCKIKNFSTNIKEAKEQILKTIEYFRRDGLLSKNQKIYAVISLPNRNKTGFNDTLFKGGLPKKNFDDNKVRIEGTNKLRIIDKSMIEFIL